MVAVYCSSSTSSSSPPPSPSPQGAFTSVVAMLRGAGVDDVISTNTFVPLHPTSFLLAPQLPACLPAFAIWIHDVMFGLGTEDQWVPPSGMSRSIMSLSASWGFKERKRGCCNWNSSVCNSAGIDVALLNMWPRLISVSTKPFSCLSLTVLLYCRYACVLMHSLPPLCCLCRGHIISLWSPDAVVNEKMFSINHVICVLW